VAEPKDGWLERDGIDLHYLEWAPQQEPISPPVLLLHGLSSNAHFWGRLANRLSDRRVVALDQRGHGLTGRPPHAPAMPDGFAMDELVADVTFLAQRLGLVQPVLVGHSWGATVSLELAARQRDFATALVFIDGPIQSASSLFSWDESQKFMQPPLPRYSSITQATDDSRQDFGPAWADDLEPFVFARLVQDGDDFVLTLSSEARLALLHGLYDSPVEQLWAALELPTFVLLARDASARVASWKERGAAELKKIAPQLDIRWYDTPHDIPLFAPDATAAVIETAAAGPPAGERAGSEATAGQ